MQSASPPPFRSGSPPQSQQPNGLPLPPEKRQKLSHGPSPLATSHSPSGYYSPYSPQWSPHTTGPPTSQPHQQPPPPSVSYYPPNPLESFNQPQPVQSPSFEVQPQPPPNQARQGANAAGAMGPPERPQKPLDPHDVTDVVALSGVDLRAEDEYLAASFLRSNSYGTTSFDTAQGGSSQSQGGGSFNQWSQGNYGAQAGFSAGPPFNRGEVSERSLEEELRMKHKLAARKYSEMKQKHLHDPFLAAQLVRERIHKRAYEEHVRFNAQGARDENVRPPGEIRPQDAQANYLLGADGKGVVSASVIHKLDQDSPVVEVLSLLSLACNERIRTLLEDAYAVSRARQHGSQGVVPPEWSSLAKGSTPPETTTAASQHISQTPWDKPPAQETAASPEASKPQVDPSSGRLPTPPTEPAPSPKPTVSFKSPLPSLLQDVAKSDLAAEKARLERRKARLASKDPSASETSVTPAPASSATPAPGEDAPKVTKKQLAAEKKSAVNEEVQRKQANATANMALGGGSKKYSWLTGGKASSSGLSAGAGMGKGVGNTPKSSAPSTPGPSTTGQVGQKASEEPGLREGGRWKGLGAWREDGKEGRGVQVRDLVAVLERDGLEKRTLARCLVRLRSDEKEVPGGAGAGLK